MPSNSKKRPAHPDDNDAQAPQRLRRAGDVDVIGSKMTTFDFADLTLYVGPDRVAYRVDSKALARGSPVFKAMLYGGFAESKPDGDWVVELPEDRNEEMKTLLAILHARFDSVPAKLPLPDLYNLLVVVDKYDGFASIHPWAQGWLDGVRQQTDEPWLLRIAWMMGDAELFLELLGCVAIDLVVDSDGNQFYGKERRHWSLDRGYHKGLPAVPVACFEGMDAKEFTDMIQRARAAWLERFLNPHWTLIQWLKNSNDTKKGYRIRHFDCKAYLFGTVSLHFNMLGLDVTAKRLSWAVESYNGQKEALMKEVNLVGEVVCEDCERTALELIENSRKNEPDALLARSTFFNEHQQKFFEERSKTIGLRFEESQV